MSFISDLKTKIQDIEENLLQKFQDLPQDHPIKKSVYKLTQKIEDLPEESFIKGIGQKIGINGKTSFIFQNFSLSKENNEKLFPPPILPYQQKKSLKETLSPQKWERRKEKIKNNIKKLTIQAGNITTKLLILQTKIVGKAIKWSGRTIKMAGYAVRGTALVGKVASYTTKATGKTLQGFGKLISSGGKAMTAALAGTKIGAILTPITGAISGLGTGISTTGKGINKVGDAGLKISKQLDTVGKNVIKTGDKITKTGKNVEKTANRMNKIRKYYVQKMKNRLKSNTNQYTNTLHQEQKDIDNMMRLTHPLEYEALHRITTEKKPIILSNQVLLNKLSAKKQK